MDATQSGVIPIAYEYETPIIASNAREKFMVQNADCVLAITDAEELFDIKTMQYAEEEGSYKGWSIEAIQEHKMGVEPKIAIFNQYLEEFSSAMDDENVSNGASRMQKQNSGISQSDRQGGNLQKGRASRRI